MRLCGWKSTGLALALLLVVAFARAETESTAEILVNLGFPDYAHCSLSEVENGILLNKVDLPDLAKLINVSDTGPSVFAQVWAQCMYEGPFSSSCQVAQMDNPTIPKPDTYTKVDIEPDNFSEVIQPWTCTETAPCNGTGPTGPRGGALSFIPRANACPSSSVRAATSDDEEGHGRLSRDYLRGRGRPSADRRGHRGQKRIEKVLFVHGGNWNMGSPRVDHWKEMGLRMMKATGLSVLSIDYTLDPFATAPLILKEIERTLRWMGKHDECGNAYTSDVMVDVLIAGDSSGAGTAMHALMAQKASKDGGEMPNWWLTDEDTLPSNWFNTANTELVGGVLFSPWINLNANTPSYVSNAECHAPIKKSGYNDCDFGEGLPTTLTGDTSWGNKWEGAPRLMGLADVSDNMTASSLQYLGNKTHLLNDPILNPIRGHDFSGIPKVQFHIGMREVLVSESSILSDLLPEAELHLYDGMLHEFQMLPDYITRTSSDQSYFNLFKESAYKLVERFAKKGIGRRGTTMHYEFPTGTDTGMAPENYL